MTKKISKNPHFFFSIFFPNCSKMLVLHVTDPNYQIFTISLCFRPIFSKSMFFCHFFWKISKTLWTKKYIVRGVGKKFWLDKNVQKSFLNTLKKKWIFFFWILFFFFPKMNKNSRCYTPQIPGGICTSGYRVVAYLKPSIMSTKLPIFHAWLVCNIRMVSYRDLGWLGIKKHDFKFFLKFSTDFQNFLGP